MFINRLIFGLTWLILLSITQIDQSQARIVRPILKLDEYYSYEGMLEYMDDLAKAYSQRVVLQDVGLSYENRTLKSITITNGDGRTGKKVILLVGGEHAREWLTPVAALYAIEELVVNFERNAHLLQDHDWMVLPQVNPDGYMYSRSVDKMWRSTRSPNGNGCFGTNINRNYPLGWRVGTWMEVDPCSEHYAGSKPFSESETRAVRDIMLDLVNTKRALMFLSLHSYQRIVFYPWAYKRESTENVGYLEKIAKIGAEAMQKVAGTEYVYKQPGQDYFIGGTSMDYAYSIGFPLSFAIELTDQRDGKYFDFWPPTNLLKDLAIESWVGLRAMAEKAIVYYPEDHKQLYKKTSAASSSGNILKVLVFFSVVTIYFN